MTVIEIAGSGGPEVLKPARRELPRLGPEEVLIRVAAAGVNGPDLMQRRGMYPPPPGASELPGLEISGGIVALGEGVAGRRMGEQVCALVTGGGYAEYCSAPAAQCLLIPNGLDEIAAAGIPETFFTVWSNLFDRARLKPGESLLVHGGSSGIGTTAIQLGRAFGARVFTTAGTDEKCAACVALGAERAINYRNEDFVAAIEQATGGKGVDVVLDMVGGDYLARNIKALAADGRHVSIAFLRGPKVELNFLPVMLKRLTLTGSTLRPRDVAFKAAIARALHENVWPLIESGKIRPVIHQTFPLAQAAAAHRLMEASGHIGKLILVP